MEWMKQLDLQALLSAAMGKVMGLYQKKDLVKDEAKRAALSVWARLR